MSRNRKLLVDGGLGVLLLICSIVLFREGSYGSACFLSFCTGRYAEALWSAWIKRLSE